MGLVRENPSNPLRIFMSELQIKNQFIKVRVTSAEKKYILQNAEALEMNVSDYMRYVCLQYTVRKTKSQSRQLRLLANIANNLNQIARQVNTHKANINKLRLLLCLMQIEEEILSMGRCI